MTRVKAEWTDKRKCVLCDSEFETSRGRSKYCSEECSAEGTRLLTRYERTPSGHPLQFVAVSIVSEATKNWRYWRDAPGKPGDATGVRYEQWRFARNLGFETPRDELLEFFWSDYFESLCEFVGESISPKHIRYELEIPDVKPKRIETQIPLELTSANWGV